MLLCIFIIEKLKIESNTLNGIYQSGIPSFSVYCNFTFDKRASDKINAKWKLNGQYITGKKFAHELKKSFNFGSSILSFRNPELRETGKIECEISYSAGSPEQLFLLTKTGYVNIAGMLITVLEFNKIW